MSNYMHLHIVLMYCFYNEDNFVFDYEQTILTYIQYEIIYDKYDN